MWPWASPVCAIYVYSDNTWMSSTEDVVRPLRCSKPFHCCVCGKGISNTSHIDRHHYHWSKVVFIIIIYPLTVRVVGAPQMISQPVSSIFLCSPLPRGIWWTPGLSVPWFCLSTSSSVWHVFFPLSLCLAKWFWPDLINRRHVHTTAVWVSLRWSGGPHMVMHSLYEMDSILQ